MTFMPPLPARAQRLLLDVTTSTLGRSFDTAIASFPASVHLPGSAILPSYPELAPPPALHMLDDVGVKHWGVCYGRPGGDLAAVITHVSLTLELPSENSLVVRRRMVHDIRSGFEPWVRCVREWMDIAFAQDLAGVPGPWPDGTWRLRSWARRQLVQHPPQRCASGELVTRPPARLHDPRVTRSADWSRAVDGTALSVVFALAGRLLHPPTALLLLRDADAQYRAAQYRRAVLDAGTAAELALSRVMPITGRPTLGSRVRAAQKEGRLDCVPDPTTGLVFVRNHAAHLGTPPGAEEALRALEIAAQIVCLAYPPGLDHSEVL